MQMTQPWDAGNVFFVRPGGGAQQIAQQIMQPVFIPQQAINVPAAVSPTGIFIPQQAINVPAAVSPTGVPETIGPRPGDVKAPVQVQELPIGSKLKGPGFCFTCGRKLDYTKY